MFPNEIIAFIQDNDNWKLITHSSKEEDLLKNLEKLIENNDVNPKDHIIIRKL